MGVQKRDVKCLNEVLKPSLECDESNKPPARRSCNLSQCVNSYSGNYNVYYYLVIRNNDNMRLVYLLVKLFLFN